LESFEREGQLGVLLLLDLVVALGGAPGVVERRPCVGVQKDLEIDSISTVGKL